MAKPHSNYFQELEEHKKKAFSLSCSLVSRKTLYLININANRQLVANLNFSFDISAAAGVFYTSTIWLHSGAIEGLL